MMSVVMAGFLCFAVACLLPFRTAVPDSSVSAAGLCICSARLYILAGRLYIPAARMKNMDMVFSIFIL